MISKNKVKYIHSLEQKKGRRTEGMFVAEGFKVVGDLINAGHRPQLIVATAEWLTNNAAVCRSLDCEICEVTDEELRKTSFLQHPQQVLATFPLPSSESYGSVESSELPTEEWLQSHLCLALDGVQDPGNLGTIIRIADWFGIDTIICSRETADAFAPKVVQATMGSIARVRVIYTDLEKYISHVSSSIPVYGTLLEGTDIYTSDITPNGIIVMGNEGNGITPAIRRLVSKALLIPSFPPNRPTAESLNVAIATAIVCAEFRRR